MQIDVIWGPGAANNAAPAAFYTAVDYVVNYYDSLFTNNVTITINVGYGQILNPFSDKPESLSSGDLGESYQSDLTTQGYMQTVSALQNENAPGSSTLPANAPEPKDFSLEMCSAEAKALGLAGPSNALDGSVGFATNPPWSYSTTAVPASDQYYLVGTVEHEFSEVMGRVADYSKLQYDVLDLYRYASPGLLSEGPIDGDKTDYFSIDNGATNLGSWNNVSSKGDLADWYPEGPGPDGNDAYNDYSNPGVINGVSPNDITLMAALGWTATVPFAGLTATASPSTGDFGVGQQITITVTFNEIAKVTGTPSLTLNDNGVANYQSGSGSTTLTFVYTVGSKDLSESALAVTGIDQTKGTVTNNDGNGADFSQLAATFAGLQIDTSGVFAWADGAGGDWNTASNWTPTGVPAAGDTALITTAGTYTVTSSQANSAAILEMAKTATLAITGGALDVTSGTGSGALGGTITVADGTSLGLGTDATSTTFNNAGTISVLAGADPTGLVISGTVTLIGKGKIDLSGINDQIVSDGSAATLTNGGTKSGNTISGLGTIGDGHLSFVNQVKSIIDANDAGGGTLAIDTQSFTNSGTLEATGQGVLELDGDISNLGKSQVKAAAAGAGIDLDDARIVGGAISTVKNSFLDSTGGKSALDNTAAIKNAGRLGAEGGDLIVAGAVKNSGVLDANGNLLDIGGTVTKGQADIEGAGEIKFEAASSTNVTFAIGSKGTLDLGDPLQFTGTVAGMTLGASIDLGNILAADDPTLSFPKPGLLAVFDPVSKVTDTIKYSGPGAFMLGDAADGTTLVTSTLAVDPPANTASVPHHSAHLLRQAMASFGAGSGVAEAPAVSSAAGGMSPDMLAAVSQHAHHG